jgi:diacylglycerol kinase family enzyme
MPQGPREDAADVPVIVNTTSGTGHSDAALESLAAQLREADIEPRILAAADGPAITALARQAMTRRPPIVVAAGGDGTLSAVAAVLRGTQTAMGVLPLGTRNHFAKDLRIPIDRLAAIRVIASGAPQAIDVGEVNGFSFLNNSSLGLYADAVRDVRLRARKLRRSRRATLIWAFLAAMRRAPLLHARLRLDGAERDCRSPFVFIGNNEYAMEGFNIGTRASLDGGCLSVYTTSRHTFGGLFRLALRAIFGRLHQAEDFSMTCVREVRVESRHAHLLVATDGEIRRMATPLEYRVVPKSLRVMAPAERP